MVNIIQINFFDVAVVFFILFFMITSFRSGFLKSVLDIFFLFIAFIISFCAYPFLANLLEMTGLEKFFAQCIGNSFGLTQASNANTISGQVNFINNLPLPDFISNLLVANNNSEIYKALNVANLEDYITNFLATLFIDVISFAIIFILIFLVLSFLLRWLKVVNKIPAIGCLNQFAGLMVGVFKGSIIIWLLFIPLGLLFLLPSFQDLYVYLQNSYIASFFYNNNLIINLLKSFFHL